MSELSISKLQELFAKSGCGLVVLIVCASVMVGGMFYFACTYSGAGAGQAAAGDQRVIMTVAGNPVYAAPFNDQIQSEMGRMGASPSLDLQAMIINQTISQLTQEGAKSEALKAQGIKTDDQALLNAAGEKWDQQLDQVRQQLITEKKLAPTATPAQFDQAVKAAYGKTPAEARAAQMKQIAEDMKDPEKRKGVIEGLAQILLLDAAKAKHNVSDSELRASYDTYVFQQLRFFPSPAAKGSVDARVQQAEADLKKGVPFEKVIDKYSGLPPIKGRSGGQQTVHYTNREMETQPALKPLIGLKVGEISPLITTPGGPSLFKLVSVNSTLPKDFDKNMATYRKEYIDQLANQDVEAWVKAAQATPGIVKFDSPAYQALNDASQAGGGMMSMGAQPSPDKQQKAYKEAVDAANGPDPRIAALARYEAESAMWNSAPDKSKLRAQRIETLLATLQYYEDFDLRMELVKDYLADGKKAEAGMQLLAAATNNSQYDDTGVQHFTAVRDQLQVMERGKSIDPKTEQQIEDAQLKWSQARADYDQQQQVMKQKQAEQAAADAKLKAKEAKDVAAARAAAAKKAAAAPKGKPATPGSTPTGSVPPASAGSGPGGKPGPSSSKPGQVKTPVGAGAGTTGSAPAPGKKP